jgi:protein-S-isoprenylcysteine O-methyltransferase Ste14
MVYFDQHIVLPPETAARIDTLIAILSGFSQKVPDLSNSSDAVDALASIERIFSNADPILRHIDGLMQAVQGLAVIMALLLFFLVLLAVVGLVLCYLTWRKVGAAEIRVGCKCGKRGEGKVE